MFNENLMKEAEKVSKNAYAPYSGFKVGAAVLTANGNIYTGCNVENVSFGGTVCAERAAVCAAVAAGEEGFKIVKIAVYAKGDFIKGHRSGDSVFPCGICLQFISEFGGDILIFVRENGKIAEYPLPHLLPKRFGD